MKKFKALGIAIIFVLFAFISCGEKPSAPTAGSAKAKDMLSLLPKDAESIVFIDFHRAVAIKAVDEAIKEDESYQKYREFVEKSGIDPQNDIYFIAVALKGAMGKAQATANGSGIINLKYNKEALLSLIKEKAAEEEGELVEEEYNGLTVYSWKGKKEGGGFTFLDESNIALGDGENVKAVIDIYQKKGENVFKNEKLSALLDQVNKEAIIWGAVTFSLEDMSKMATENPFLSSLDAVSATCISLDYKDRNIIAEIKVISSDETKNAQVADFLSGLKAMGGMAAAQDPNVGELLSRIEISSGADHVKITANISEELIEKLKKKKAEEEENY
ncbi:MAG: hypothetical protein JSV96_11555 [Candidatus Aminicenantes bacterium]|nr:MAG: hypothetical protein JSV96_11555 [Candidatus Aminicenantes bacterium]